MQGSSPLFDGRDLLEVLDERKGDVLAKIQRLDPASFLSSSPIQLINELFQASSLTAPRLLPDAAERLPQKEIVIELEDYGRRLRVPGLSVSVAVSFEGEAEFFLLRPSTYTPLPPSGSVSGNELLLTYEWPASKPFDFKNRLQQDLKTIQEYLSWVASDIYRYNQELLTAVEREVTRRRERLLAAERTLEDLGLPTRSTSHPLASPQPPAGSEGGGASADSEFDAFICHASEDKEAVVEPLVKALIARDVRVWYDRMALTIGDSLRRSIDEGLERSRFGIVILSPAFFRKGWPQRELDGLVQKEIEGRKVVLPVWHNVTHADVAKYSLPLADRVAGLTSSGIHVLADGLMRAIKGGVTSVQPFVTPGAVPSGNAVRAKQDRPEEKWVDINYPRDSGLQGQLAAEGYRVKWCFDGAVARAVDLDGWEVVYQDLGEGRRAMLKLRDRPDNQTLLKKRQG